MPEAVIRFLLVFICVALIIALISQRAPVLLRWFGRLPGDRLIKRDDGTPAFPLTSFVLLSLALSLLAALLDRM